MSSDIKQSTEAKDGRLTSSHQETSTSSDAPPLPVLPDDDMDDDDENFPLITSVFSLASSDNDSTDTAESPKKTPFPGNSKDPTSHKEPFSTMTPKVTSPEVKVIATSPSSTVSSSHNQVNVPYYVGKGKLLLPKTAEGNKTPVLSFSKMIGGVTSVTTSSTSTTNTMLTRSALKKAEAATSSSEVIKSDSNKANTYDQIGTGPVSSNLTSSNFNGSKVTTFSSNPTVTLNVTTAHNQSAVPPTNNTAVSLQQTTKQQASITTPLIKTLIQKPITTSVMPLGTQIIQNPAVGPVIMPSTTVGRPIVNKSRHVNIAPAPLPHSSKPQFVVVPKTAAATTATTSQVAVTNPVAGNTQRVIMVPKQNSPTPGQLMYLIENKTADGKTFKFLIPTDSAKIVTSPVAGTQSFKVTSRPPQTTQATSPTQVLRIIPKVPGVTSPVSTSTTPVTLNITSPQSLATATVGRTTVPLKTSTPTVLTTTTPPSTTGNITPPCATSPTINMANITSPISEEDSISTPPDSPPTVEEPEPKAESIDTGLSPHEARIQKLKELLRKQEDAVEKLREKRKKEIDDVRSSATKSHGKDDGERDSPFAVPLPPKRPRLDTQSKRNKMKETASQTSKDGFLPNTDDVQFAKLLGLEKVVDKLKTKKLLELNENKAADLN